MKKLLSVLQLLFVTAAAFAGPKVHEGVISGATTVTGTMQSSGGGAIIADTISGTITPDHVTGTFSGPIEINQSGNNWLDNGPVPGLLLRDTVNPNAGTGRIWFGGVNDPMTDGTNWDDPWTTMVLAINEVFTTGSYTWTRPDTTRGSIALTIERGWKWTNLITGETGINNEFQIESQHPAIVPYAQPPRKRFFVWENSLILSGSRAGVSIINCRDYAGYREISSGTDAYVNNPLITGAIRRSGTTSGGAYSGITILSATATINSGTVGQVALTGSDYRATSQTLVDANSLLTEGLADARYQTKGDFGATAVYVKDEFIGGGNSGNQVGELNWFSNGTVTWTYGTAVANRPGIWRLQNSSIANGKAYLEGTVLSTFGSGPWEMRWIFRLNKITNARWAFGAFPNDISTRSAAGGNNGFYYDSSLGPNWHVYISNGSGPTDVDLGIAATTNWTTLRWRWSGTALYASVADSSGVFSSEQSIPTTYFYSATGIPPAIYLNNTDGVAQSIDLDFFGFSQTVTR